MPKRALLALLASMALHSLSVAGTNAVTSKHKGAAAPPTADILQETFTDVSGGYATAGWTESLTGTVDEDEVAACPAGTGWATQCLETTAGAGVKATTEWNLGSTRSAVSYIAVHFDLASAGAWADTQEQIIFTIDSQNATIPSVFTATAIANLVYYTSAVSDPNAPDCSAYPCWRLEARIGGNSATVVPQLTTGVIHNLRFKVESGASTGEIILDGVTIGSGFDSNTTSPHGAWQYIRIGHIENAISTETIYWDDINVSSTGYVD